MTEGLPRIAFYCSSISWGGLEMNTVRYASWMKEAGYSVFLYTVQDSAIHKQGTSENLEVRVIERNRKYFDISHALSALQLFRQDKVSLVWFRDTRDMDMLAWVKRFSGGDLKLLYQQAMQFGVSKKDILHSFRFAAIDRWVATLEFLASQVRTQTHFDPSRIAVVPLGVDKEVLHAHSGRDLRSELNISGEAFVAGVVGRIDPLKDQLCAIRALHHLGTSFNHVHLIIAGESTLGEGNDYEKTIRRQVHQFDLQHKVHFIPYTKEIGSIYRALDAFILTSKGETFGTVTIEAMSFGLPVVGTRSSGTPEILAHGEAGLLYEPGNSDELSQHWRELIIHPDLRKKLGHRALQEFDNRFSRRVSVASMQKIIHELFPSGSSTLC